MLSSPRSSRAVLATLLALCVAFALALQGDITAEPKSDAPVFKRPNPHPLHVATMNILADQDTQLEGLQTRIAATTDIQEVLELQREVQRVKLDAERRIMQQQLDAALNRGDAASIMTLQAAVENLDRLLDRSPTPSLPDQVQQ